MNKWMIWGYHYFWKHPNRVVQKKRIVFQHLPTTIFSGDFAVSRKEGNTWNFKCHDDLNLNLPKTHIPCRCLECPDSLTKSRRITPGVEVLGCFTRVSMEVIVTNVSKLVYFTYLWDVSNLLIKGSVIIHLLSTGRTSQ